jgi:hypothetical protein
MTLFVGESNTLCSNWDGNGILRPNIGWTIGNSVGKGLSEFSFKQERIFDSIGRSEPYLTKTKLREKAFSGLI